jgi:hypothetical protein
LTAVLALLASPAVAELTAWPSSRGTSGLYATPSAKIVPAKSLTVDFAPNYVLDGGFGANPNEMDFRFVGSYGIVEQYLEVGAVVPLALDGEFGLAQPSLFAKSNVLEVGVFHLGLQAYALIPGSAGVGSGDLGYGGALNASLDFDGGVSLLGSLAFEKVDFDFGRDQANFAATNNLRASGGVGWMAMPDLLVFGEMVAEAHEYPEFDKNWSTDGLIDGADNDLYIDVGARYRVGSEWTIAGAIGVGLPGAAKSNTDLLVAANLAYRFDFDTATDAGVPSRSERDDRARRADEEEADAPTQTARRQPDADKVPTRDQTVLGQVTSLFDAVGWKYRRIEGRPIVTMRFKGKSGPINFYAIVKEGDGQVLMFAAPRRIVPEDKRSDVPKVLMRVNQNVSDGIFLVAPNGQIRFQTIKLVQDGTFDMEPSEFKKTIAHLVRTIDKHMSKFDPYLE